MVKNEWKAERNIEAKNLLCFCEAERSFITWNFVKKRKKEKKNENLKRIEQKPEI